MGRPEDAPNPAPHTASIRLLFRRYSWKLSRSLDMVAGGCVGDCGAENSKQRGPAVDLSCVTFCCRELCLAFLEASAASGDDRRTWETCCVADDVTAGRMYLDDVLSCGILISGRRGLFAARRISRRFSESRPDMRMRHAQSRRSGYDI